MGEIIKKMETGRLFLSIFWLYLCMLGNEGQEISSNETGIRYREKVQPLSYFENIEHPKNRKPKLKQELRIFGGSIAKPNEYPFQVALKIRVGKTLILCGGTLLTVNWVLTAAHCFDGPAFSVKVILGVHDLYKNDPRTVTLTSNKFVIHEKYDSAYLPINDIALLRLPRTVALNKYIALVNLDYNYTRVYDGLTARCLGWGTTALGEISAVLRFVDLKVISNKMCQKDYGWFVTKESICTSGKGSIGSCTGDSGGPLMIDGVQVGIVSFGSHFCEDGRPTAYTKISKFNSWISAKSGRKRSISRAEYLGMVCLLLFNHMFKNTGL